MKTFRSLVAVLVLVAPRYVHAAGVSNAEKDAAREMAQRGAAYFDNRDWERARAHFRRAYDVVRAPTLALMEARALVELGCLVEAEEAYARATNVSADPANAVYQRARVEAGAELAALQPRVPTLSVVVPQSGSRAAVRVDGVPRTDLASIPLNPGTHLIAMLRSGSAESWQSVTLREGERRTVVFAETPVAPGRPPSTSSTWMWAAFGLGGAGLATGLVTGVLASDRKSTLDNACQGVSCPPEVESDLSEYRTLRTVSTIGYVAGLLGVASGIAILATRREGSPPAKVAAVVSASPSGVVISGGF